MTTNIMKKAAEATNSNGPHTDTNIAYFPTDGTPSKAIAPTIAPSPRKAVILATLAVLFDPADVFSIHSLTTKKRIKAVMEGTAK